MKLHNNCYFMTHMRKLNKYINRLTKHINLYLFLKLFDLFQNHIYIIHIHDKLTF